MLKPSSSVDGLRILFVTGGYPLAGHTFVSRDIAGAIEAGAEVKVLAANQGDTGGYWQALSLPGRPRAENIYYKTYSKASLINSQWGFLKKENRVWADFKTYGFLLGVKRSNFFAEIIDKVGPVDLVHGNFCGWSYEVAMPLARLLGVPFTVSVHDNIFQLLNRKRYILETLQKEASGIALVSKSSKNTWVERTGEEKSLKVIYNGIDIKEFGPSSFALEQKEQRRFTVVSVGRFSQEKRFSEGIQVMAYVIKQGYDLRYWIIGDGPCRKDLEGQIKELKMENNIFLLGSCPHSKVRQLLEECDVFFHSGLGESFGLVVAEALAARRPVVAADSGAINEIVDDEINGFLYYSGEVEQAGKRIVMLQKDGALRKWMGEMGRKKVEKEFGWQKHIGEMCQMWSIARI